MEAPLGLIEFPADDPERAQRFWSQLLEVSFESRLPAEGEGWQTPTGPPRIGLHARGTGPGDRFSLPYFVVADLPAALDKVTVLGGDVIHPGDQWAVCRDSEGNPFGLARE